MNKKDIRLELYEHMVSVAPDNAAFNDIQKPYIIEYMQRYHDSFKVKANETDKSTKPALNMQSVNVSICCKTCEYHNIDNEIKHRCSNTVSNDELSDKLNGSVCGNWKQKAV